MLPQVLYCKHTFEVCDKIHKYFNAHMKVWVRQLHVELKSLKKGNSSITEYILHVKVIANLLLSVCDAVTKQYQTDSILDGILEEYNPFVMQMHGTIESLSLYDAEAIFFVLEAQLDKFR